MCLWCTLNAVVCSEATIWLAAEQSIRLKTLLMFRSLSMEALRAASMLPT